MTGRLKVAACGLMLVLGLSLLVLSLPADGSGAVAAPFVPESDNAGADDLAWPLGQLTGGLPAMNEQAIDEAQALLVECAAWC